MRLVLQKINVDTNEDFIKTMDIFCGSSSQYRFSRRRSESSSKSAESPHDAGSPTVQSRYQTSCFYTHAQLRLGEEVLISAILSY